MLKKTVDFISEQVVDRVIVLFFLVMSGSVFVQVLFRYVLHKPIYWSEELPRVMLIWLTFLGATVAMRKGSHLGITLFTNRLKPKAQLFVQFVANLVMLSFLIVLFVGGVEMTMLTMPNKSAALQMPTGLVYLAIPVGAALMLLHLILQTGQVVRSFFRKNEKAGIE